MKKIIYLVSLAILAVIGVALWSTLKGGGGYQTIRIEKPSVALMPEDGQVMAGAVSVDITPPPGTPKGAYSSLGNTGIGFRTRLKARIFYLSDGKGESIALIQTDMSGGSLLVQHKIAAAVGAKTGIKPRGIVVTGTHSHSAFANHFHNDFYNKHFSNQPGLEPEFLELVSQRIADGVLQAYAQRRPAKVATGKKDIYGYNRNRMLEAYALNNNHQGIDVDDPETKFKEVNPSLYMLRIDAQDVDGVYKPLGAFSSFSVHATSITPPVKVYNADLFGYAQRELEWAMQAKYQPPWQILHGMTTGTQGDMAPALPEKDSYFSHGDVNFKESKKLGQGIGLQAITLFESLDDQLTDTLELASAAREINIRENTRAEDVEICQQPLVGNTTAGGAYERRFPGLAAISMLRGGGWGSKRWWFGKDSCHGSKRIVGTSLLQPLMEPTDSFPYLVLFQIIRINDMAIMPLPFEMTTESGRRVSQRVQAEFAKAGQYIKYSWVASVANGYFGYSTTEEEYEYQSYEGGSTMYGKYSTPYITAQLGLLARDFATQGPIEELANEWSYYLSTTSFMPKAKKAAAERKALSTPELITTEKANEEDYVVFRWLDVGPSQIDFHKALGSVQLNSAAGWQSLKIAEHVINDEGYDVEVRHLGEQEQGMSEYELRWYNPVANGEYRFAIQPRLETQAILYSESFSL